VSEPANIAILELLSSKICHDLINPIGAVNNGIEFMEEMGPDAGPEAKELIAYSALQATAKLQAFRLAYGAGGADAIIKVSDVHKTIQQVVEADKKITQHWDPAGSFGPPAERRGFCKILTCVLMLAIESLPKGGKLNAYLDGNAALIKAEGVNASMKDDAQKALAMTADFEKLNPKDVHPCMTGLMAAHYGFNINVTAPTPGIVEFRITAA
jgi:histidine phosphotransferase ChpT